MRPCPACDSPLHSRLISQAGYELLRCAACELIYVGNPPTLDELRRVYSFDAGYHTGFRDDPAVINRQRRAASAQLNYLRRHRAHGRLLDIGCSAGFFMEAATAAGWEALGVELSGDTAELARGKGLEVIEGTLAGVPTAAGPFDAVTMFDVLEHVEQPRADLERAHELLAPGGLVVVMTPNADGLLAKWLLIVAALTGGWLHAEPPAHLSQFSKRSLESLLNRTGFRTLETIDSRLSLLYVLGGRRQVARSPARMLAGLVGAPLSFLGPRVKRGDWMVVVAERATQKT